MRKFNYCLLSEGTFFSKNLFSELFLKEFTDLILIAFKFSKPRLDFNSKT